MTQDITGIHNRDPYTLSSNGQVDSSAINAATDTCIEKLTTSSTDHCKTIRDWAIQIYKAHNCNLSEDNRDGHQMDVWAMHRADNLLNPVLLTEIEKLIPHSDEAFLLLSEASTQNKPLAALVFHFDTLKLKNNPIDQASDKAVSSLTESSERKRSISEVISQPETSKRRNKKVNRVAINTLTDACIKKLNASSTDHGEAIRDWATNIYQAHDCNISKGLGGHLFFAAALGAVDELLNPFLLREIEKLIPHSDKARLLLEEANTQNKPLSELAFQNDLRI